MKDARTPEQQKGQNGQCETVTVKSAEGPVRINAHDFDEKKHELFEGKEPKKAAEKAAAVDFSKMTKEDLQAYLDGKKVQYAGDAKKADLVALCEQAAK